MEPTTSAPTQDVSGEATQSSSQSSAPKKYSCVMCQQRKVKCDKQYPCSACERGRATCVYRAPRPSRRRKGRRELVPSAVTEVNLIARLKRYEELLTGLGVTLENGDATQGVGTLNIRDESPLTRRTGEMIRDSERQYIADEYQGTKAERIAARTGNLVSGGGKSRLFESHMWASVSDEFEDSKEMLQSSSEDEGDETPHGVPDLDGSSLIFGVPAASTDLCSLHPSPVHIFKLWQAFLDNFNPLVKILHVPTLQPLILEAAGDLASLPKGMETLLFAIYSSAVTTMSSAECEGLTGEPKSILLARYHAATKMALISAGFLKSSNMLVLKAYVLFLLSIRNVQDSRSLWTLTGIAVRIGQRLGLHRDGEVMDLPVFETEMRRRLWWQIIVLDTQSAELSGSGVSVLAHLWDTKVPLNLNDSDLYPQMTEPPMEHAGPTEMMFCRLRYQVGEFFRTAGTVSVIGGSWHSLSDPQVPVAEKDKTISEIEQLMEDNFLRYCDPAIPLHSLSSIMARAVLCQLRVLAHHPSRRPGGEEAMSVSEINLLFTNSLKAVEYDNLAQSSTNISRFLWHIDVHFQWLAFIYLLGQLRCRTIGEEADRAWQQVEETYNNRPEIITDSKNALHTAVRDLTIRAWEARVAASGGAIQYESEENLPKFISLLGARGTAIKGEMVIDSMKSNNLHRQPTSIMRQLEHGTASESLPTFQQNHMPVTSGYTDSSAFDILGSDNVGPPDPFSPMDWAQWDDLIRNYEL